jgi:polysaccharide deacetylase family protein (PEP-CTERM system associated)
MSLSTAAASRTAHHFTVDVEEYFQVSAFASRVVRSDWERFESRVARGVARLLDLLARYEAHATFFVLGWVAERKPALIRLIAGAGHEIASHGWDHARVTEQTPLEFRDSIRRSKRVLEDLAGAPVLGYRAPSFSIVPGREWALDILIEEGYCYDSSLFPVRRPGYGYPGGRPDPHWLRRPAGRLAEIPPATLHWCGLRLPAAGGAYFRLLPYGLVRAALRQCQHRSQPGTFFIHPWELDPAQPRFRVPWLTRVRHYGGLRRTEERLERLLAEFRFTAVMDTVAVLSAAPVAAGHFLRWRDERDLRAS